jgi:hypothetical protein
VDLLIITCSKAKNSIQDAAAMDVYNGNRYRILRKRKPGDLRILIISAKYGLIESDTKISWYDKIMTVNRAIELHDSVTQGIKGILGQERFRKVFLDLPFPYDLAVNNSLLAFLDTNYGLAVAAGPRGRRLHQFSEWLREREVQQ